MNEPESTPALPPAAERAIAMRRALQRLARRLERKLEAIRADLAECERGIEHRRAGEALLTYLRDVPPRAASVTLPDPADHERTLAIELDPRLTPQANAA